MKEIYRSFGMIGTSERQGYIVNSTEDSKNLIIVYYAVEGSDQKYLVPETEEFNKNTDFSRINTEEMFDIITKISGVKQFDPRKNIWEQQW